MLQLHQLKQIETEVAVAPPVSEIPTSLSALIGDLTLEGEDNVVIPDLKVELSSPTLEIAPSEN